MVITSKKANANHVARLCRRLAQRNKFRKMIFDDEGDITERVKQGLREARAVPIKKYVPHSKVRKRM